MNGLTSATITLNKSDLHAIAQTITLISGAEAREFSFNETEFQQEPASSVRPEVFEPEPELLSEAAAPAKGNVNQNDSAASVDSSGSAVTVSAASPELEIEVTYLLNRIRANLGEQVNVSRTPEGALRVEAFVETEARKQEIIRALGPVIHNPAVRVEVSTVAEALARQKQTKSRDTTVREVDVTNSRSQAEVELRAYFSARMAAREAVDEEIDRYTSNVMMHSRQALLRASALRTLVNRFSPEQIRGLAPDAQAKWLAMIHEQASACKVEVVAMKQALSPIFKGSGEGANESVDEATLQQAAERLVKLSYANDESVRSAFTVSAESRSGTSLKSPEFWRSLSSAEKLAEAIQRVYQK
jgi:hypothetical protein